MAARTWQHRGVVVAKNGMVAASQPLAVSAGMATLRNGGSFADAAIAISAVLCVVEPYASHLGGDAFAIVYDRSEANTVALNGSGAAPAAANADRFPAGIPVRGLAAASVPGLVHLWGALHARWGRIPIAELLAPALCYASEGYPIGFRSAQRFAADRDLLEAVPGTAQALLGSNRLPSPGDVIIQSDLAWTLGEIARNGPEAFYKGAIAERIVSGGRSIGGLFSAEDLANHQTEVLPPIKTRYRGYTVHGQPPVSQGHILLQMLNLLEGFDLAALGHNSAQTIHLQTEAKKLAFADRSAYLGDPGYVHVPIDALLSKKYADQRRNALNTERAALGVEAGLVDHDTTYFCVVDADGNAVSFIQSVFWGFGSAAVVPETGILFNNRMTGFSLQPGDPNVLTPGKRTAHTLNAYLVTRDEAREMSESAPNAPPAQRLAWVGGTPGGDVQVQSNLQVICNVVDFGMNPQQAVEAPRWQHGGAVGSPGEPTAGVLAIEDRIDPFVTDALREKGHTVEMLSPWSHASAYQLIAVDPTNGALMGGSDPRVDGHAAGY